MQQAAGDHTGAVLSQRSETAHEEERKNSAERPAGSSAAGGRRVTSCPPRSERLTNGVSSELTGLAAAVSADSDLKEVGHQQPLMSPGDDSP